MAALVARLNQAMLKSLGFLNPPLYASAAQGLVHDVTVGTNGSRAPLVGYRAGPGWDACTGLGTPGGTAILTALQGGAHPQVMADRAGRKKRAA